MITNPEQKRVTEPRILEEIIKRLKTAEPVALVTGRSIDFTQSYSEPGSEYVDKQGNTA